MPIQADWNASIPAWHNSSDSWFQPSWNNSILQQRIGHRTGQFGEDTYAYVQFFFKHVGGSYLEVGPNASF
jgi:hypothetical protein